MQLKILASSSGGNCGLVEVAGRHVMIDAGLSFKKITALLADEGLTPEDISAVLVTHEHSDHTAGLGGMAMAGAKIYATEGTALGVGEPLPWNIVPTGATFALFSGVTAQAFRIPHDAADPVGYTICDGVEKLSWALDLGHLDGKMRTYLADADILMLESNYDAKKLEASKRPYYLKARIKGRHGHLDNDETFEYLTATRTSARWREIFLGHLSRECNDPEALEARYDAAGVEVNVVNPFVGAKAAVA